MSKKRDDLLKGFDNLLVSTEVIEDASDALSLNDTSIHHTGNTPKSNDVQKYKRNKATKCKDLKKCTLYLPEVLMDSLAIMKVKTKRDLSELAAEALETYLKSNNSLYE